MCRRIIQIAGYWPVVPTFPFGVFAFVSVLLRSASEEQMSQMGVLAHVVNNTHCDKCSTNQNKFQEPHDCLNIAIPLLFTFD
jgi:hypothetical protein